MVASKEVAMDEGLTIENEISTSRQRPTIAELALLASRLRRSRRTPSVPNLDLFDDLDVALSQPLQIPPSQSSQPAPPTPLPQKDADKNDDNNKEAGEEREAKGVVRELSTAGELPSVGELYELYEKYNLQHFGGRLPAAAVTYSTRMLAAGSCTPTCREIKIGRKYHQVFPEDITDTLLHEMIHLIYPGHDRRFRVMAKKLGVSVHARSHPSCY